MLEEPGLKNNFISRCHMVLHCAGAYMIPTAEDIPADLRVTLLEDQPDRSKRAAKVSSTSQPESCSHSADPPATAAAADGGQAGEGSGEKRPPALVHSSKNAGEPPFFLGASAFFALKQAVYAARWDAGQAAWVQLDSPASTERVRMACGDHLVTSMGPLPPICS